MTQPFEGRTREKVLMTLTVLLVAFAGPVNAQRGEHPVVRAVVAEYQSGDLHAALSRVRGISGAEAVAATGLDQSDLATLALYEGLIQIGLDAPAPARAAFVRAVRLDPTVTPDPELHAPSRIAAYQEARRTVAVLTAVRFDSSAFRPLFDTLVPISFALEAPPTSATRAPAIVRVLLVTPSGDSVQVWRGAEGGRAAWSSRVRAAVPPAGRYHLVAEATERDGSIASRFSRPITFTIEAPAGAELRPDPVAPTLLPEADTVLRTDGARKRKRILTGLATTVIGAGLAIGAYKYSENAAISTSEGSSQRVGAAAAYGVGLTTATVGGILTLTGLGGGFKRPYVDPLPENIAENARRRQRHASDAAGVHAHNDRVRRETVVRISTEGRP